MVQDVSLHVCSYIRTYIHTNNPYMLKYNIIYVQSQKEDSIIHSEHNELSVASMSLQEKEGKDTCESIDQLRGT